MLGEIRATADRWNTIAKEKTHTIKHQPLIQKGLATSLRVSRIIRDHTPRDIPFIGPMIHGVPGRKETLLTSLIVPAIIGGTEAIISRELYHAHTDLGLLAAGTIGVLAIARAVEMTALKQIDWSSIGWTYVTGDSLKLMAKWFTKITKLEVPAIQKLLENPLFISTISRVLAILTYPINYKDYSDGRETGDFSQLYYLLAAQSLGDAAFAFINGAAILIKTNKVKREQKKSQAFLPGIKF